MNLEFGPMDDKDENEDPNGEELESENVLPEELEDLSDGEELPSNDVDGNDE